MVDEREERWERADGQRRGSVAVHTFNDFLLK